MPHRPPSKFVGIRSSMFSKIGFPVRALGVVSLTAALGGFCAPVAHAQDQSSASAKIVQAEFAKERGGTARINLSAKLRMLSQRIAAESCIYAIHANDDTAQADLSAAVEEFGKIIKALEHGDESIGILGSEDSAKILKGLKILAEEWSPMETSAKALLASGGDNAADLAIIYEQEAKVLKIAQKLAAEINAIYTDPASMTVASAMMIDIAGRQRMLTQKMTKEACQISTGAGTADTPKLLETTVSTFDTTLSAMIDGMPEAGMPPPPTPEIRASLEAIQADWLALRAPVDAVVAGTPLDATGLSQLLVGGNALMKDLNEIVADYADAATY
jgi:hypothetical protein